MDINRIAALKYVLEFISTEDLLTAAMNGFALKSNDASRDNSDICFKAIQAFLQ